jgi:hypothetical protein
MKAFQKSNLPHVAQTVYATGTAFATPAVLLAMLLLPSESERLLPHTAMHLLHLTPATWANKQQQYLSLRAWQAMLHKATD